MTIRRPQLRPRRGFSFAEVMFAVVILGIGFIMVAGIFPVALQQTQASSQQATAAAFAKDAAGILQQLANYNAGFYMPATGSSGAPTYVYAFDSVNSATYPAAYPHGSWPAVAASLISSDDPRYAFVPLYFRPYGASYAQVYIINTQVQTRSAYDINTGDANCDVLAGAPTTFMPKLVHATISGGSPGLIAFNTAQTGSAGFGGTLLYSYTTGGTSAVGSGCYAIVAQDYVASPNTGILNGKIFRIGNHRPDLNSGNADYWELVPGSDYVTTTGVTLPVSVDVWVVGKQLDPPLTGNYTGNAQDLSLYSTYISIP